MQKTLSQRFKEHTNLDKPTGAGDHCWATRHSESKKNTKVLNRESNWHKRKEKRRRPLSGHRTLSVHE